MRLAVLLVCLIAVFGWAQPTAPGEARPLDVERSASEVRHSVSNADVSTTPAVNTHSLTFRGYDASQHASRAHTPASAGRLATKGKVSPTVGELRGAGNKDAHHVIQDAAVRDVPGYRSADAPGVTLPGPSTRAGSPHYAATQAQRSAGVGGTYGAERQVACMALAAAGCSRAQIQGALSRADAYFMGRLGLRLDSPLRFPGNRRIP